MKADLRKRLRSSIGWLLRASIAKKASRSAAERAGEATIVALPQPSGLPRNQAEDEQEEAAGERRQAGKVDPLGVLGGDVGEPDLGQRDGDDADRDVDEEDPLPAEVLR